MSSATGAVLLSCLSACSNFPLSPSALGLGHATMHITSVPELRLATANDGTIAIEASVHLAAPARPDDSHIWLYYGPSGHQGSFYISLRCGCSYAPGRYPVSGAFGQSLVTGAMYVIEENEIEYLASRGTLTISSVTGAGVKGSLQMFMQPYPNAQAGAVTIFAYFNARLN
jgi:hypothetical protein